jgi:hypothetical protein
MVIQLQQIIQHTHFMEVVQVVELPQDMQIIITAFGIMVIQLLLLLEL